MTSPNSEKNAQRDGTRLDQLFARNTTRYGIMSKVGSPPDTVVNDLRVSGG